MVIGRAFGLGCVATVAIFSALAACGEDEAGPGLTRTGGSKSEAGASNTDGSMTDGQKPAPAARPFEWTGIMGTGQSLSVGSGFGEGAPNVTTTQPYENKMLVGARADMKLDAGADASLVPLIAPVRAPGNQVGWPLNIRGETPNESMGNQISVLSFAAENRDYLTIHSVVGEGGQILAVIDKRARATEGSTNGKAYAASLYEARMITELAKKAGKTFGYGAITLHHGESDENNANALYAGELQQLWADYNADLPAITGQTQPIPIILSQQSSFPLQLAAQPVVTNAQWKVGVEFANKIFCAGPKYQYEYSPDFVHMPPASYRRLGEKMAQVYFQIVSGQGWKPLQPNKVERAGKKITVTFDVPYPPLNWDETMPKPHTAANLAWTNGRGFEVVNGNNTPVGIESVEIAGSTVVITTVTEPTGAALVRYAMTQDAQGAQGGTPLGRRGQLRDSDPFVGFDKEKMKVKATAGSANMTAVETNAFQKRTKTDRVSGAGLDAVVLTRTGSAITLSAPWPGATGEVEIEIAHEQRNYLVAFEMPVP